MSLCANCNHPKHIHLDGLLSCRDHTYDPHVDKSYYCQCRSYKPTKQEVPAGSSVEDEELRSLSVLVLSKIAEAVKDPEFKVHLNFANSEAYTRGYNEGYDDAVRHMTNADDDDANASVLSLIQLLYLTLQPNGHDPDLSPDSLEFALRKEFRIRHMTDWSTNETDKRIREYNRPETER